MFQIFTERKEIYSLEQELAKDEICLDDKPIRNMKFIDYMLDLHTFNDQEIKDEVNTFTFAVNWFKIDFFKYLVTNKSF